jgi:UDP-glucuronate 4-epimerase
MSYKYKIVVTGGAGFIGSHLIDELLEQGHEVLSIDNFDPFYDKSEKLNNLEKHFSYHTFTFKEADITDKTTLRQIIASFNPQYIFHLAAKAGVRPSVENPDAYVKTNVNGSLHILEIAREVKPVRTILASSSSVYGLNGKIPFSETDATLNPASPYAATKIGMEALAHTFSHLFEMDIVSLRFFTVYGPRQRPDLAIRKFMQLIESGKPITLFGDGSTSRDYTYIDDIIQGVIKSMEFSNSKRYEVFNLGNSSPVTLTELIRAIEITVGKKAIIEYHSMQSGDVPVTYADITKSKQVLGYMPETSLHAGLENMYKWLITRSK